MYGVTPNLCKKKTFYNEIKRVETHYEKSRQKLE